MAESFATESFEDGIIKRQNHLMTKSFFKKEINDRNA